MTMTSTSRTTNELVIASRGSRLALIQADTVARAISQARPDVSVGVETITTTGDRDQRPFGVIGGKGLFSSEVERAVAEGTCDLAVHSAKDLTADLAPGCTLAAFLPRGSVHDVVVGGVGATGEERLLGLPAGALVGTSSMRRRALMSELRSDIELVELRGNLDTRLKKVANGEVAAAILAAAGIERLEADADTAPLDPSRWIPAPAQGAIAVEARIDRPDVLELLAAIDDADTRAEVSCERAFAERLEGGCSVPLGCLARANGSELVVTAFLGDFDGGLGLRDRISGPTAEAAALGSELAVALLNAGGDEILAAIRSESAPTPQQP
ncbi:MAG: hydroxymethylbilane synthase [Actinomycetota bacterium]|nr:hydroxymethylbilane synthase [Actinomycetota bacterium]